MFIYEGLVTVLINHLSRYKRQFNTLKGLEICDCILLISKRPFMLHILKMRMVKELIVIRPPLVKMWFIVIF